MAKDDLIRQTEAAELASVGRTAIGQAIERGQLRTVERYGLRLVRRSDVLKLWPDGPRKRGRKPKRKGT